MQVKEIKQDGLSHEIEVTITAKDIDERVDGRLKEVGKTIRMPGFRPGKVPLPILKKRYGKAIMGEVLEQTVNETSEKVLKDKELRPALQPKIEVKSFDDGKDLVYSLAVEVIPQFKVKEYKGIKLEKLVAEPDDKEVANTLEKFVPAPHETIAEEKDRAAVKGDVVNISFDGRTADDDVKHPGMQADEFQLKLGSGQFIEGFEDQLIGKKKGDKVEVKVAFPKEYGAEHLSGRDAIFDVEIKEIRVIDKEKVKERMVQELDGQSRLVLKKALMDYLDNQYDFEIPPSMAELEYNNIIRQVEFEQQQSGEEGEVKLSAAEEKEFKEIAARRVRLGLVLSQIGTDNKVQVADAELQRAVITEAQRYPGQEKEVFDYYSNNRQALESLRAPIFEQKVVDFILELADLKEKKVSMDALVKALDDPEEEATPKKEKKETAAKKPAAKKSGTKSTSSKAKGKSSKK